MMQYDIKLKKQPQKYLLKADSNIQRKLLKALDGLKHLKGDIVKLRNSKYYRLKLLHYRIVFERDDIIRIISVEEMDTRTNINYRRYSR